MNQLAEKISDSELDVMKVLWEAEDALPVTVIREKLQEIRESYEEKSVPTEAEIGGIGLTNTYARCLLLFGQDLIFELGNRTDQPGFFVRLGLDNSHNK